MDAPKTLFERLSEEAQEWVPVALRILPPPGESTPIPVVTSRRHRAPGYICQSFHRPISKCFPKGSYPR